MAGKKKTEKVPEKVPTPQEAQATKLEGIKASGKPLVDLFKLAEEYTDLEVVTVPTGFPALDRAFVPKNPGIPLARYGEISSATGNVGKTTIVLQIIAAFQELGKECGLAEPEATNTESHMNSLGVVTRFDPLRPHIIPMRIMRPEWDTTNEETIMYSAQTFLNGLGAAVQTMDLVVLDSVAALASQADLDKDADDNSGVGGISKLLNDFFRRHTKPKAAVILINQQRDKVGGFSPGGGTPKTTPGGHAIPFYSTWRIKVSRVETIASPTKGDEPIGFLSEFEFIKNKLGPADRKVRLPHLHGEGFSIPYALFMYAVTKKVIQQNGAWYQFPTGDLKKNPEIEDAYGYLRTQGQIAFYESMRERPDTMAAIQAVILGEDPEDLRPPAPEVPAEAA